VCHCRSLIFLPPPSFLFPSATGQSTWDPGVFTIILIIFPFWWLSYNKHSISLHIDNMELPAKLLDDFLRSYKSNINQTRKKERNNPPNVPVEIWWENPLATCGKGNSIMRLAPAGQPTGSRLNTFKSPGKIYRPFQNQSSIRYFPQPTPTSPTPNPSHCLHSFSPPP